MEINSNCKLRALVHTVREPWVPSPMPGVERRMLDRIGGEVARATSIVRYAPQSRFSPHTHDAGEEFLVLEGVFQDEHGDYPPGTYVRNPPGSTHAPRSAEGCTIFVKLRQFAPDDRTAVRIETAGRPFVPLAAEAGVAVLPLFEDLRERVRLERWEPGTSRSFRALGGLELLVLEGSLIEGTETLTRHDWLRLPAGTDWHAVAGPAGVCLWVKERQASGPPAPE